MTKAFHVKILSPNLVSEARRRVIAKAVEKVFSNASPRNSRKMPPVKYIKILPNEKRASIRNKT